MFIDSKPLFLYRDYRFLYWGQLVSSMGTMISYVVVPYQVYQLTQSSFSVGLLGAFQAIPVLFLGLWGGAIADRMDRRKLLLVSEGLMSVGTLVLAFNAWLSKPNLYLIFAMAAFLQAVNAFHRPAMEAITQKLVHSSHYAAVAALSSFSRSSTTIAGPALGGFLIARYGAATGYLVDFFSYLFAFASIGFMNRSLPPERSAHRSTWQEMRESLSYAGARPVLIGTYLVDIVAMIFAFPTALFPAMAETWGGSRAAGFLYAGMSVGSLIVSLFSGWSGRIQRHGLMVVLAAAAWGLSIVGLGLSHSLAQALFFLAWAGATDSVSAIYRMVIWNETIPNDRRGKLAGLEMISYLIGPLLGNLRAGWMAGVAGISISIWMGGLICTFGVGICGLLLPEFWRYRARPS